MLEKPKKGAELLPSPDYKEAPHQDVLKKVE